MKKMIINMFIAALALSCGKDGGSGQTEPSPVWDRLDGQSADNSSRHPYFKHGHVYLALDKKGQAPKIEDEKYTSYTIERNRNQRELNYFHFDEGLRNVHLEGLKIRLGGSNSHSIYELIKETHDVERLHIVAHTLIIEDRVHVAGAEVSIHAKKIVFAGKGSIVTTPVTKSEPAQLKHDGAAGLAAGNISVFASEWDIAQAEGPILIADGGAGQPAGPGIDGARGANAKIVHGKDYYNYQRTVCRPPRLNPAIYLDLCIPNKKQGRRSSSGKDAEVGGRPGVGGSGGAIAISYRLPEGFASVAGGLHGAQDRVRVGGAPGRPETTCAMIEGKRKDCATARKGKDAQPRKLEGTRGKDGEVIYAANEGDIDLALFHYKEYASDLYLSKRVDEARQELEYLEKSLSSKSSLSPQGALVASQVGGMLQNIRMRLDYFGKRRTWAPKLNFPAALKLYRQEGESNLKLYFLSRSLLRKFDKVENQKELMQDLRRELFAKMDHSREQIANIGRNSANLRKSLADLEVAQSEFEWELRQLEKEIRSMAKNNLRVPSWKKALQTISAISKAVPVGQPTFGAVGAGVDTALALMTKEYSPQDLLRDIPSLSEQFKDFNWEGATAELERRLVDLDPRKLGAMQSNEERLEYLRQVDAFARPVAEAVQAQVASWKSREMSKGAIAAEIERIKRSHKVYQATIKKLEKLLVKKEEFLALAKALQSSIASELAFIQSGAAGASALYSDMEPLTGFKPDLKRALMELQAQAKKRFKLNGHILEKAYAFQFLENFPVQNDLAGFFSRVEDLLSLNESPDNVLERLKIIFNGQMSELAQMTVSQSRKRSSLVKQLELDSTQLKALNRGESIFLDFTDLEFFGVNKENIRIHSVRLDEEAQFDGYEDAEAVFEHYGESVVVKNGNYYFFNHSKDDAFKWISSYQRGEVFHTEPSETGGDELRALLGIETGMEVFSLPGGRSFVKVSLSGAGRLLKARVRVAYSFEHAP